MWPFWMVTESLGRTGVAGSQPSLEKSLQSRVRAGDIKWSGALPGTGVRTALPSEHGAQGSRYQVTSGPQLTSVTLLAHRKHTQSGSHCPGVHEDFIHSIQMTVCSEKITG